MKNLESGIRAASAGLLATPLLCPQPEDRDEVLDRVVAGSARRIDPFVDARQRRVLKPFWWRLL
jgi:hypothetical protein